MIDVTRVVATRAAWPTGGDTGNAELRFLHCLLLDTPADRSPGGGANAEAGEHQCPCPNNSGQVNQQMLVVVGPKPAGGRGPLSRGWVFRHDTPAQVLALVALDSNSVWLFSLEQAREQAQQHAENGNRNFVLVHGAGDWKGRLRKAG